MNKRETVIKHEGKVYTVKTEDIGRSTKQEVGVSVSKGRSLSSLTEDEIDKLYEIADYILYGDGTGMDKGLLTNNNPSKIDIVWIDKFEGNNRKDRRAMKAKK